MHFLIVLYHAAGLASRAGSASLQHRRNHYCYDFCKELISALAYAIIILDKMLFTVTRKVGEMYSKELKKSVLEEMHSGSSVSDISGKYAISRSTLYSWKREGKELPSCKYAKKQAVSQKDYEDLRRHAAKLEQFVSASKDIGLSYLLTLDEKLELYDIYKGSYSAKLLCEILGISRGTYSNRIVNHKVPTYSTEHRAEVKERVIEIFDKSQQRYGSDKILATLQKEGIHTSKQMVRSIIKELDIQSIGVNAKRIYTKEIRVKRNILKQDFNVKAPNMVWVDDITQFWFKDKLFYICAVLDLFSRKIVAYKISKNCSTKLVTATLRSAYDCRGQPQNLIFHSDRGSQYTSNGYMNLLRGLGITQSFSRSGSPYDNAVIESFFNIMKKEELHRRVYRSEREFQKCVDEYISFYNSIRPHRYNDYNSPDDAEKSMKNQRPPNDFPECWGFKLLCF